MSLIQAFRDYLGRKHPNIQVTIEPDSGISFTYENLNFRLSYYPSEPTYYRLTLPRVAVRQDLNHDALCKIASEVSAGYKVGKIVLINDEFWICYEQLLDPNINNDTIFDFSILVLRSMITVFRERINSVDNVNQD